MGPNSRGRQQADTLDRIAIDLQELRVQAGAVSYGEIATRITDRRLAGGRTQAAAQVARSSVYDAFRLGRRRTSPDLVAEIALALGADAGDAAEWRRRCAAAQSPTLSPPAADAAPRAHSTLVAHDPIRTVMLMIACLGLNLFGHEASTAISVPLFLDMIGTAISAIVLGPWHGVAVALATNSLGSITDGTPLALWFGLVNMTGALLWGFGVRRWGLGRSPLRYLSLTVVVALACSVVAVPIIVLAFGGLTGHPSDDLISTIESLGEGVWAAVGSANVLFSILDKLLASGLAVLVFALLVRYDPARTGAVGLWIDPPRELEASTAGSHH